MISIVDKFLNEYSLTNPDNTLLVGFSGGYDSICLLDILHILSQKYGFKIVALHLNHNWRGAESLQEEINCKNFCEHLGVEFVAETLEKSELKTEEFARESRYNFFVKHAKKYQYSSIFTAHTRTDNAETLIYRIIKGTGIQGLKGIPAKRLIDSIPVYRPLLSISRKDIENYCNSKGLIANVDSSNLDISYKRNFIRHKIMPLFDEINFHAEKSIASLAKIAISESNIVDEYMILINKQVYEGKKLLSQNFLAQSDDVQKKIIYDIFLNENLEYDNKKIENLLEFIKNNSDSKSGSRYSLTNNLWMFVSYKHIYLITKTKCELNNEEISITQEGEYEIPNTNWKFSLEKFKSTDNLTFPSENTLIAYVNLDETGLNFTVRTRRDGDFITPFGMNGKMKLKKYLNSKKISQHEKDGLILLSQGSEVLWVAGVGLSNKLKVVNQATHVIKLKNK